MVRFRTRGYFDDAAGNPPAVPPTVPPPPAPKTFTQDEVNKMMADHKRTLQSQNTELVTQLEALKSTAGLTAQQRDELETRIQTLSQQHLTKEQQLQAQLDQVGKKAKADLESALETGKKWRSNYETTLITNSITLGATQHQAAKVTQMLELLSGRAKVVEVLDDKGQPTGQFAVKIPVNVTDPKTKKVEKIELDAIEAIGKLREDPDYANMFLFDGKAGIGGNNVAGGAGGKPGEVSWQGLTPEQHREQRKRLGMGPKAPK